MNKVVSWLLWPMTGGVTHREVQQLASEHMEGTLPRSIGARFRLHLRSCHDCNLFVATLRATVLTIKGLPQREHPADLEERILARIRDERAREHPPA